MNVLLTMVVVLIIVQTPWVIIAVLVIQDILSILMVITVLVCLWLKVLKTYFFLEEINECNNNNGGCEHSCHNTNGSYYCSCNTSYIINSDNHHCDGKIIDVLLLSNIINFYKM